MPTLVTRQNRFCFGGVKYIVRERQRDLLHYFMQRHGTDVFSIL